LRNKISILIIVFSLGLVVANPFLTYAQQTSNAPVTNPKDALPQYNSGVDQSIKDYLCTPSVPADGHDLERCINRLYRFSVSAGALVVIFFIVLAGYLYITGGESGKTKGKAMLLNSITGLGIILLSYVLLYFINPSLVVIKPIQPPIFNANDIPSCDDIGFEGDCDMHGSETDNVTATANGTGKAGTAVNCSGGVVSIPSSIPVSGKATRMCKDLLDKLVLLKSKTSIPWVVTSTMRGSNTISGCHASSGAKAGNCADIQIVNTRSYPYDKMGSGSSDPRWGEFCEAVISLGGVNFANEASNTAKCQSIRKYHAYSHTTGPHLHVNFIGK
jgi:hypothetical protein